MIEKQKGIEHTLLLIYLGEIIASFFEMVYYTQQLTSVRLKKPVLVTEGHQTDVIEIS